MEFLNRSFIELLDTFIVILLVFGLYHLLRKTGAVKIILGFLIIIVFSEIASNIGLLQTSTILNWSINFLLLALVIIFSNDIRLALTKIGGITKLKFRQSSESQKVVNELRKSTFFLSSQKMGALIVLDRDKIVSSQSNNLVKLDAKCKAELLNTIFFPNTALHDGAVIISDGRIAYAGCKLPLEGKVRGGLEHYGTRHLVAMETAEKLEVTVIVVSEETGSISIFDVEGVHEISTEGAFLAYFEE